MRGYTDQRWVRFWRRMCGYTNLRCARKFMSTTLVCVDFLLVSVVSVNLPPQH